MAITERRVRPHERVVDETARAGTVGGRDASWPVRAIWHACRALWSADRLGTVRHAERRRVAARPGECRHRQLLQPGDKTYHNKLVCRRCIELFPDIFVLAVVRACCSGARLPAGLHRYGLCRYGVYSYGLLLRSSAADGPLGPMPFRFGLRLGGSIAPADATARSSADGPARAMARRLYGPYSHGPYMAYLPCMARRRQTCPNPRPLRHNPSTPRRRGRCESAAAAAGTAAAAAPNIAP